MTLADSNTMCCVARRPCGCICFAAHVERDVPEALARDIGMCILEGLTVERMTVAQARADPKFFTECLACAVDEVKAVSAGGEPDAKAQAGQASRKRKAK